jgi:hypothetical protein
VVPAGFQTPGLGVQMSLRRLGLRQVHSQAPENHEVLWRLAVANVAHRASSVQHTPTSHPRFEQLLAKSKDMLDIDFSIHRDPPKNRGYKMQIIS